MPILILVALALSLGRLFVPTIGHSWPTVFMAAAHIYVGVLATLLWLRRGRWPLGWACLLAPSLLEAAMFFLCAPASAAVLPRPAPVAESRFTGKFELVPLFDAGHRPVIDNGHTDYAERNRIGFRTDAGDLVAVPAGAPTDLASIPALVWPLMPPDGPYAEAAAVHDECYRTGGTFDRYGLRGRDRAAPYTRAECDEILREAMAALGVRWWPRVPIFTAVRLFGGVGWGH